MTTYTPSLRLWQGTPGDPAIKNAWGTALNTNDTLIDEAGNAISFVGLTGLTTYALTVANGAPDQARGAVLAFTGALGAPCTVTLPNVPRVGWAVNLASGNQPVTLTTGAGTTAVIPPDGSWRLYNSDGAGNVITVNLGLPSTILTPLTLSSLLTPNGGIAGLLTSASAGQVGEFQANQASGIQAPALSSANICALFLTPGDWDVDGTIDAIFPTQAIDIVGWVSQTPSVVPPRPTNGIAAFGANFAAGFQTSFPTGPRRFLLSATTAVWLSAQCNFPGGGVATYNGVIRARRMH